MTPLELLSDESKWCNGYFAKDKNGNKVSSKDPSACCWCLLGAVRKCFGGGSPYIEHELKISSAISRLFNIGNVDVVRFNDTHSYADVRRVLEDVYGGVK